MTYEVSMDYFDLALTFSEYEKETGMGDNLVGLTKFIAQGNRLDLSSVKNKHIFFEYFTLTDNCYNIQLSHPDKVNLDDVIKCFRPTDKFYDEFNSEYNELNSKHDLSNRIGVHIRFFDCYQLYYLKYMDKLLKVFFKLKVNYNNDKFMIAVDNIDYYNQYKYILKDKDIFILDIPRADTVNTDMFKHMSKYNETHYYNSLKEAYFISKCKDYIPTQGLYSLCVIPLLRYYL